MMPVTAPNATLLALALLLDRAPGRDLLHFTHVTLPRLLNHLSRETERRRVEQQGQIRGGIDWPATYRARYGDSYAPTRFVCRQVHHQFDTLENQLLRHTVDEIGRLVAAMPDTIRTGTTIVHASDRMQARPTYQRLAQLEGALRRTRRNIYLRQVTPVRVIGTNHRHRAQVVDMEEYRTVLALHDHLTAVQNLAEIDAINAYTRTVFSRMLPIPAPQQDDGWAQQLAAILAQ